jgi:hypothetical protein
MPRSTAAVAAPVSGCDQQAHHPANGRSIRVTSVLNAGSQFHFSLTLPVADMSGLASAPRKRRRAALLRRTMRRLAAVFAVRRRGPEPPYS